MNLLCILLLAYLLAPKGSNRSVGCHIEEVSTFNSILTIYLTYNIFFPIILKEEKPNSLSIFLRYYLLARDIFLSINILDSPGFSFLFLATFPLSGLGMSHTKFLLLINNY